MGVLPYFQVIKYKLCRCVKKKHKGRNNNDRGAVLSLDDVKRHVSMLLLSTFTVSHRISLTGARSLLCPNCRQRTVVVVVEEEMGGRRWRWRKLGRERLEGKERDEKVIGMRGREN